MALTDKLGDIANAIRNRTGDGSPLTLDQMPAAIDGIESGVTLEPLGNPAWSEQIYAGYEAYGSDGYMITGTAQTYEEGVEAGKQEGHDEAYAEGKQDGYGEGYSAGQQEGYQTGKIEGYQAGYEAGKQEGGGSDETAKALIERTSSEVTIPDDVTSVADYAFYNWSALQSARLPDGIRSIGGNSFGGCTNLTIQKLPGELVTIANYAFNGCKGLSIDTIPAKVNSIGGNSFANCTGITSLRFLGTPNTINALAFNGCTNIRDIYVPWIGGVVAGAPWGATNATIHYLAV